jgi:GNAT superfamily N-acetyltransferase
VLIRPAVAGDAESVARVHIGSWQVAYRGLIDDDYLDALRWQDRAATYAFARGVNDGVATIVAVEDDTITGFATYSAARDDDCEGLGEVRALYVDPNGWRHGTGGALIAAARAGLVDLGFDAAVLWVLEGNERAMAFYRRDGWQPDGARRVAPVFGVSVPELRYRRPLR